MRHQHLQVVDARLLGMFYLAFNDQTIEAILETYDLTRVDCVRLLLRLLLRLDKLGLIEWGANDAIRLRVAKSLRLRSDGPIRQAHGRAAVGDFLHADFASKGGYFLFEFRELSRASVVHLERKLTRIAQEFHELAELDGYLPAAQRQTIGIALGIRPWVISRVAGLNKRKAGSRDKALSST